MFKKCKNSVCSTNSIAIGSKPKRAVTVVRHTKTDSAATNAGSIQGTNLWLRNGGALPCVALDPQCHFLIQHKPKKLTVHSKVAHTVPKRMAKPQGEQLLHKKSMPKNESPSQATLKPLNHTYTLENPLGSKVGSGKENNMVVNKQNYKTLLSHFNEQDYRGVYDPAEYSERKHKHIVPTPCCTERKHTMTPPKVDYSDQAKADILHSIREELKVWRNEGSN